MSFRAFIKKTTAQAKSGVSKVSNTVKLYSRRTELTEELNEMFDTLGKMTYYTAIGESGDGNDTTTVISEITRLRSEIEAVEKEIREINGKKQCTQCYAELQRDTSFCPHCGAKVSSTEEAEPPVEKEKTSEEDSAKE